MTAKLIHERGDVTDVTPANGTNFTLKELYAILECQYVEVLYLHSGDLMIVDEEGKPPYGKKEPNFVATQLYRPTVDHIVGKAIVCNPSMFR